MTTKRRTQPHIPDRDEHVSSEMHIVGNVHVLQGIVRARSHGRLPQSLMITGPDHVGKTTIAKWMAANIVDATVWPGRILDHPDCWIDDQEGERILISRIVGRDAATKDQCLLEFLSKAPYGSTGRCVIIAHAEQLTDDAANTLLKTLEEPPPQTTIVLTAPGMESVLPTIASRVTNLRCHPAATEEIADWLMTMHQADETAASAAALRSGGLPGRALTNLVDTSLEERDISAVESLLNAAGHGTSGALNLASDVAGNGAESRDGASAALDAWGLFLHDTLQIKLGREEHVAFETFRMDAAHWASKVPYIRLVEWMNQCVETRRDLTHYVNVRLAFDVLCLSMLTKQPAPPLRHLERKDV